MVYEISTLLACGAEDGEKIGHDGGGGIERVSRGWEWEFLGEGRIWEFGTLFWESWRYVIDICMLIGKTDFVAGNSEIRFVCQHLIGKSKIADAVAGQKEERDFCHECIRLLYVWNENKIQQWEENQRYPCVQSSLLWEIPKHRSLQTSEGKHSSSCLDQVDEFSPPRVMRSYARDKISVIVCLHDLNDIHSTQTNLITYYTSPSALSMSADTLPSLPLSPLHIPPLPYSHITPRLQRRHPSL